MNETGNLDQFSAETVPPKGFTLGDLIEAYTTDRTSTYHALRYNTRKNVSSILKRLHAAHGHVELSTVKRRELTEWHMDWSAGGKVSMAHSFIAQIRTMTGFGASMLENQECERISMVLHRMRFPHGSPRVDRLTADQAEAIRILSHNHFFWPSMALAQALQFELLLRQGDVIGTWVPMSEPCETDVVTAKYGKWSGGLRWEEINDKLILKHRTSKKQKDLEIDLKLAPMVMEELALKAGKPVSELTRADLPVSGPMVICDTSGWPWTANEYRRKWRLTADQAGIPKSVKNMDSRAGGITEATESGADLEHVKHAATHSDIAQTQRYSRGASDKIVTVQKSRIEFRNKKKFLHGE